MNIRIGRMPGRIVEQELPSRSTVASALVAASLDAAGYEIRVQGAPATPATILNEGDLILLVKKIKGNSPDGYVTVRVGEGPKAAELVLADNAVVAEALAMAGVAPVEGQRIFQDGRLAELEDTVRDGAVITVGPAIAAVPIMPGVSVAEAHAFIGGRFTPEPEPEEEDGEFFEEAVPAVSEELPPHASKPLTWTQEGGRRPSTIVVEGTDPAVLRAEAQGLRAEAEELREAARHAAELDARAAACEQRATEIEVALAALASARARVAALGVVLPAPAGAAAALGRLPKAALISVAKGMGLTVAPRATKAQLVAQILGHE